MDDKSKVLVLVEGDKTDVKLMKHLFVIYNISKNHEIVSYHTNIYTLYNEMFKNNDPKSIDLLQNLKEHEPNENKKKIFDSKYTDILLIFDLDPQDPQFAEYKIKEMVDYFVESSDMGKLYLNYPMVEAFYHMKSIPDMEFDNYLATKTELKEKKYKTRVNLENRNRNYSKFAINKKECNTIIQQNIDKSWRICNKERYALIPLYMDILDKQLEQWVDYSQLYVLCTCVFYIPEYNSDFIKDN